MLPLGYGSFHPFIFSYFILSSSECFKFRVVPGDCTIIISFILFEFRLLCKGEYESILGENYINNRMLIYVFISFDIFIYV